MTHNDQDSEITEQEIDWRDTCFGLLTNSETDLFLAVLLTKPCGYWQSTEEIVLTANVEEKFSADDRCMWTQSPYGDKGFAWVIFYNDNFYSKPSGSVNLDYIKTKLKFKFIYFIRNFLSALYFLIFTATEGH